ncbi:MAG: hypothetical protein R3F61_25675 [Myxococcota bacterium]
MWLIWLLSPALSACPDDTRDGGALDRAIESADAAVEALDPGALAAATDALDAVLACQERPISVQQAAHLHRIHGIRDFVSGDAAASDLWFAASRALEPSQPLGHTIGGPLESAWSRAATSTPPQRTDLPSPRRGVIAVDGQLLSSHPTYLPWVFQHVDGGEVITSALVPAASPPPQYPGGPKPPPAPGAVERRGKPLSIAFAGVSALAVGSLAGAAVTRSRYKNPDLTDAQVEPLLGTNRALGYGGYALGAAALGLGTAAVVVEW